VQEVELAVENLVAAGLTAEQAFDAYSAVSLHVQGSVVLQRLYEKNRALDGGPGDFEETMVYDADAAPLLTRSRAEGHRIGAADDTNFEYGLNCILDNIDRQIAEGKKALEVPQG
jgi:hypothetical protein